MRKDEGHVVPFPSPRPEGRAKPAARSPVSLGSLALRRIAVNFARLRGRPAVAPVTVPTENHRRLPR